jgi:hypothetical protein
MKLLVLAFAGLSLWGQAPVLQIDSEALRRAQAPVEQWLGAPLVLYVDTALVPTPEPGEAFIAAGAIYLPLSRLLAFRDPLEAARFLSHAAAHRKLDHAARYAEKAALYQQMTVLSPHFPQATMEANMRANLEKEAEPVAAEFFARSGCTPRRCDLFKRLLDAAPKP